MAGKALLGGAAIVVATAYIAAAMHAGTFDPRAFLMREPGLRQLAALSSDSPRAELPRLLEEAWDYACFVQPYHPVADDAKLTGIDLPWTASDGYVTVVPKRAGAYAVHRFGRDEISAFELTGLAEGEACYASTNLLVEFVSAEAAGFKVLRVTPR